MNPTNAAIVTARRLRVKSAGALMAIALGLRSGTQFVILVCFSRAHGVDGAAEVVLATALVTPLQPAADLGLRQLFVLREQTPKLSPYLRVRIGSYFVLAAVLFGVVQPATQVDQSVLGLIFAIKFVDAFSDVFHAKLQRSGRLWLVALFMGGNAICSIIAAIAVIVTGQSPFLALWGSLASSVLFCVLVVAMIRSLTDGLGPGRSEALRHSLIVRAGIPLGVGMTLTGVSAASPQYILAATRPAVELTHYAYLGYVIVATDLLVNGLTQAWLGRIAESRNGSGSTGVLQLSISLTLKSLTIVLPLALVTLWLLPGFVHATAGLDFHVGVMTFLLTLCAVACLPACFVSGYSLNALEENTKVFAASLLGGLTLVVSALALVPSFGLSGALAASATGALMRGGSGMWFLKSRVKQDRASVEVDIVRP